MFLVISRCEDEVYGDVISQGALEVRLNSGQFEGYEFLSQLPYLEDFPSKSVYIFRGEVVIPRAVERIIKYNLD